MFTALIQSGDERTRAFSRYIPKEIYSGPYGLENPETIALGVAADGNVAAGALVSRVTRGWIEIMWLYIEQSYRKNGYGSALLDRLLGCMDYAPDIEGVFAQCPDKDDACARLFSKAGFTLEQGERSIYELTLADLNGNPFWEREPAGLGAVVRLKDVFDVNLRELEVRLGLSDAGIALELPASWRDYDGELSSAYIRDGRIEGIMLIEQEQGGLYLSFAYVTPGENTALPAMLYKTGKAALDSYPPKTAVRLNAVSDVAARLTEKLFPELSALPTRYAVYRAGDNTDILMEEEVWEHV